MRINGFSVNKFRSLNNFNIDELSSKVLLFGDNDTGKSNILAFLEMVFMEKYSEDITDVPDEGKESSRRIPTGFWRGIVEGFSYNYFLNAEELINFSILISFSKNEITNLKDLPLDFLASFPESKDDYFLEIFGVIHPLDIDRSQMELVRVTFDGEDFYNSSNDPDDQYLAGFEDIVLPDSRNIFQVLMMSMNNCFLRVPALRFLRSEEELNRHEGNVLLSADNFKNWLFQINLNNKTHSIYQKIIDDFSSPPIGRGNISIARVSEKAIELFVEGEKGLILPIGRKGTGIQQLLVILAYIAQTESSIIGIEEIELNLSPSTQKEILRIMVNLVDTPDYPLNQLFLTTHSRIIAGESDIDKRIVALNENGETRVDRPGDDDKAVLEFWNPL
ncbi:MAG: ATP-binding protein [Chloroflexi bacterium]|nr:ATP-binding protein [Chloroflexota bacterium]